MSARPAPAVGENVLRLVPYVPGKPIDEVRREFGLADIIKLASNENALGPSPKAIEAIRQAACGVHIYPDGSCHELRHALAAHLDVAPECLFFGNGSDEIIQLLGLAFLRPGDEVIQADPSFVRYEAAAILNEAACHLVPLREWRHDLGAMAERFSDRTRLIFVANPNNPTGTMVSAHEVDRFLADVPDRAVVVFDEAYVEYVDSPDFPDTAAAVRSGQNVVVLRTFSKVYGLAGLRLGFGIARKEIVHALDQVREPFNVNFLAQVAGVAALADTDHVSRAKAANLAGARQLYDGFRKLGLPFTPTSANFVWVDVRRDCAAVFQALLRKGVIVRTGDIFGAPTHLRVTIGTPEENERFLNTLADVLV